MDWLTLIASPTLGAAGAYAVWEIQHRRERGEGAAVAERARQAQSIRDLQEALEELVVASNNAHAEQVTPIGLHGAPPLVTHRNPDRPLSPDAEQQLAAATRRVQRFQAQVTDEQLHSIAEACLTDSHEAVTTQGANDAHDALERLDAHLRSAHHRAGELLRTPRAS
jgi:hypothetical protein